VGAVLILPNEFAKAQREYPIFFRKESETGQFYPVALLGLEENENLFLDERSGWRTKYIPLSMQQGPFIIGAQQQDNQQKLVVFVDESDARIQSNASPTLFNPDGTGTATLDNIRDILFARHEGVALLEPMAQAFLKHNLLEQVIIEIDLANGAHIKFDAGYTIHIERLSTLENDAVIELHKSGLLSLAYNVVNSIDNLHDLINLKNAKMK
jgi:hypothetical protein